MQLQKFANVELGLLEDFNLADVDIVKGVDAHAGLLNVFADRIGDQFADNLCNNIKIINNLC